MRKLAFINEKGDSCKTTLARVRGCRVLLIDPDPQGQLSKVLGIDVGAARGTALNLLLGTVLGNGMRQNLPVVRARQVELDLVVSSKSLALFPE